MALVEKTTALWVSSALSTSTITVALLAVPPPGHVCCAAYCAGFFHSLDSFAIASDALIDVIPADVVADLIIAAGAAAAAHGPYAGDAARVYHACSAGSHPSPAN